MISLRRKVTISFLALALCLLSACTSPTVAYFPVRQDSGPSPLALNSGKLVLKDGCFRLAWPGSSELLIWPHGYTYRVSGSRIDILNENGAVVAHSGQFIKLGGGEVPSIQYLTGTRPPENCPGPYWLVGEVVGNLYPWDFGAFPALVAIFLIVLVAATLIVWFIIRRRKGSL